MIGGRTVASTLRRRRLSEQDLLNRLRIPMCWTSNGSSKLVNATGQLAVRDGGLVRSATFHVWHPHLNHVGTAGTAGTADSQNTFTRLLTAVRFGTTTPAEAATAAITEVDGMVTG